MPNDFKFLVRNRHVDRDFDAVIRLKEADSAKIMEDLKGSNPSSLLLMANSSQKDMKTEQKFKIIQQVDIMNRIFDELNDVKTGKDMLSTPQQNT